MKKVNLILAVLFAFVVVNCNSFDDKEIISTTTKVNIETKKTNSQKLIQCIKLDEEGSVLELLKNEVENITTLQTKNNYILISRVGCGNSSYVKNRDGVVKLDTLSFFRN